MSEAGKVPVVRESSCRPKPARLAFLRLAASARFDGTAAA